MNICPQLNFGGDCEEASGQAIIYARTSIGDMELVANDVKAHLMSGYLDDAEVRMGISWRTVPFLQKPFTAVGKCSTPEAD